MAAGYRLASGFWRLLTISSPSCHRGSPSSERRTSNQQTANPAIPSPKSTGGSQSGSIHYSTAEFIYLSSQPNPAVQNSWLHNADIVPVENALLGGNRAVGSAITLATGHVLIVGGVGTGDKGLVHQPEIHLWNPY